ncbi:MAG TPA: murein biosynthesis integral membrane protein MurJ [Planctomycetaceae bacterium]|nr:murein biosynthesis integral membrane protein MurJ [Planctomycetaceae bacterium]
MSSKPGVAPLPAGPWPTAERPAAEPPSAEAAGAAQRSPLAGLRIVGILTLLSRILGLARDVTMAAVFGNGAVMDAFSVAFRVPNLARRVFGEGALTAAFLPMFVREYERHGPESAWKLASAVLNALAVALCALVLAGELLLWATAGFGGGGPEARLLTGLTAVMLPYLVLVCLAAQIGAVMNALGHFAWPAFSPMLLNVVWIGTLWWVVPALDSPTAQVYAVAASVVLAGVVQLLAPWRALRRLGFRYSFGWRDMRSRVADLVRSMLPIVVGLSITQLNTLADSVIAWSFSEPERAVEASVPEADGLRTVPDATDPDAARSVFSVSAGTASALYFAQRMYQFPLGIFGVALGTVLFPLLARHAEAGRLDRFRDDLGLGLRLVMAVGLPASVGLVVLARPLTALLFQHGEFDARDAETTAGMIAAYSTGVWAYCGLLIVHRGYYAVGDRMTPLRVGLIAVVLHLGLNFLLLWLLGGAGLALATALAAMFQLGLVVWLVQSRIGPLDWRRLGAAALRASAACGVMTLACLAAMEYTPAFQGRLTGRAIAVVWPMLAGAGAYLLAAWLLRLEEVWLIFRPSNVRQVSAGRPGDVKSG